MKDSYSITERQIGLLGVRLVATAVYWVYLGIIAMNPGTEPGRITQAYIDPGSGSLIWQLIVASAVGVLFQARGFIRRLFSRFGDTPTADKQDEDSVG